MSAKTHIEESLKHANITLDCEIVVGILNDETVKMTEVFRIHESFPLEFHPLGNWSYTGGLQWTTTTALERKNNLKGLIMRASIATVSIDLNRMTMRPLLESIINNVTLLINLKKCNSIIDKSKFYSGGNEM